MKKPDEGFNNEMLEEDFDSEVFEEDPDRFSQIKLKQRKDTKLFIVVAILMLVLIVSILVSIFIISYNDILTKNSKKLIEPYYIGEPLIFPDETEDWRFTYAYGAPIFYCKINKQWYKCFPKGVSE